MPEEQPKAAYREIVLKTMREKPWQEGKGFGLWIVQTVKNGKSERIKVIAGMYKPNKVTGEKTLPKDGLEASDLKTLAEHWNTIKPLLEIPKGTVVEEIEPDAALPEPEQMPF